MKPLVTSLARNVFFSGVSFLVVGLIGLLLVPLIIHGYGIEPYGIIVFTRSFLPSGVLGLFDCGVTEVATKVTAQRRAGQMGQTVRPSPAPVLLLSMMVGLVLTLAVALLSPFLYQLLVGSASTHGDEIRDILLVTAASLLVFFPGLAVEGMVRGCENFLLIRATEVLSLLIYAVLVLTGLYWHQPYAWAAYAFLGATVLRTMVLAFWVGRSRLLSWSDLRRVSVADVNQAWRQGWLFSQSKILGTMQTQLPVLLVGLIAGATGAALYDVIMRLPRFFKSVLGMTVSVVFPVSARLDTGPDKTALHKLMATGLAMLMVVIYPLITAAMVFSKDILTFWIGSDVARYWPWMSLMFSALLTNTLLSYALTIGTVRESVQRQINILFVYQAILQFLLSFLLVDVAAERAFVLGQAVAMLAFFPVQMRALLANMQVPNVNVGWTMLQHLCIFLLLMLIYNLARLWIDMRSITSVALAVACWVSGYLLLAYKFALNESGRSQFKTLLGVLRR